METASVEERRAVPALGEAVARTEALLPQNPPTTASPALLMLSGLPGAGKSYLAQCLAQRLPFVILESDRVRKALFPQPTYSSEESTLVHRVCRIMMERLLARGVNVIYDATNLSEFHRRFIYHLADKLGVKLVVVRTVASEEVIKARLEARKEKPAWGDASDADWEVYKKMLSLQEPIERPHLVVDTSQDIDGAVAKVLRQLRR